MSDVYIPTSGTAADRTGADGFSPIITETENTNSTYVLTIQDKYKTIVTPNLKGAKGADGTMTFEELTDEQKASLKGEKGEKGDKGDAGEAGPQGATGPTGPQGPAGETGATGPQGADGAAGKDGVSPTITTSKSGKVTTITIKDAIGTKTAIINDGADGTMTFEELTDEQKASLKGEKGDTGDTGPTGPQGETGPAGKDGTNGVSPTINVSKENGITTINITDATSTKSVSINDGAKGDKGEKGDKGDTGAALTYADLTDTQKAALKGEKGDKGDTGATPNITMSATADATSLASPTVSVSHGGTNTNPTYKFAFKGLKGAKGDKGDKGDTGATGPAYTLTDEDKSAIATEVMSKLAAAENQVV